MSSSEHGVLRFQSVIQTMTLITVVAGVASVFMALGRKDVTIESNKTRVTELWDITQELVKSQVLGVANDGEHQRQIEELKRRLDRLEDLRGS